jgi:hypothetical protein
MSKPLSAVDSIAPAFDRTKRQLFVPFRFERWARLAVVALITGEFANGGGSAGSYTYNQQPHKGGSSLNLAPFGWGHVHAFLPWIVAGIVLLFLLLFLWIYAASVYRFVLFDSVLYDRCELKGSWGRWEPYGRSYFFWCLSLFLAVCVGIVLFIGGPLFFAWRAGWFQQPHHHLVRLILGGVALLFVLLGWILVTGVAALFAKDFCVPLMALENLRVWDAWRCFLPMLDREKLAYAGYVLMKIVLAVGCHILFGIVTFLGLIVAAIPLGIAGFILFSIGKAAGLTWDTSTITIVVILGGIVALVLLYLIAFINTPVMVFFQSYVLHFFGGRYPRLDAILSPPQPAPQPDSGEPPPLAPPPASAPAGG